MPIIDAKNLSRAFGSSLILKNISLQVSGGSVYGLVGLNGAGKTTLIRVLLGLIEKDGGSVEVAGFDPWRHQTEFYRMVGAALESDGFFGNLTVKENLRIFAAAKGIGEKQADEYFEKYWGETDIYTSTKKVKHLSRGQRVQCGLCRAFLGWPTIYFFDEPTVNLDFLAYEHFKSMAHEAKSRGAALLISSHQLEVIDDLCERVGLLRNGELEEVERLGQKFSDIIKLMYETSRIGSV
ncbi:MAG: ABC transporter ATP-binding protein [Chitinispirillales bacterium]|jgi:ABC-type multidrug transport system ATPase subunit|nr:ABC transporter ATP-binding protein [Chitinispirillales bacterium]